MGVAGEGNKEGKVRIGSGRSETRQRDPGEDTDSMRLSRSDRGTAERHPHSLYKAPETAQRFRPDQVSLSKCDARIDLSGMRTCRAQLGLGHSYSRAKVKFNVNRADNMIIQAISLLDTLDRDINTFTMRIREWYSWHFPELAKMVTDSYQYVQTVMMIKDKSQIDKDTDLQSIADIVGVRLRGTVLLDVVA